MMQKREESPLTTEIKSATLEPESDLLLSKAQLMDLERQLLSLLVTVQRAMGKGPPKLTRAERRKHAISE